MSRAAVVVEEVSDSEISDPSEGNISDFDNTDIIRRVPDQAQQPQPRKQQPQPQQKQQQPRPPNFPPADTFRNAHILYPIYFDATRTRSEGRRIPKSLAVANPLARTIAEACSALRLQPLFEPSKTHPADWANPGRVRVQYPPAELRMGAPNILNKHHLFMLVAKVMREMPTTEESEELRAAIPGVPLAVPGVGEKWPRPAVPRGWKIGELLPLLSAALPGGGMTDEMMEGVMKSMREGGNPMEALMKGMGGAPAVEEKKKKDKKKK